MSESEPNVAKQQRDILFSTCLSGRYHRARRRFFESWETTAVFLNILLGSAAVYTFAWENPEIAGAFALAFTILTAAGFAIGFTRKTRLHEKLAYTFARLESDVLTTDDPTLEKISRWRTRRIEIEHDEPPIKQVLALKMYNEQCRAIGREDSLQDIAWWKSALAQYVDIAPQSIRPKLSGPKEPPVAKQLAT